MITVNTVNAVKNSLRERIRVKLDRDWWLNNPHLWADNHLGARVYEKHTLGSKWRGWQPHQVAFLRDVTDIDVDILYAICTRGGSKTHDVAVGLSCILDTVPGIQIGWLGGSKIQAQKGYKYLRYMVENSTMYNKLEGETTQIETRIINDGKTGLIGVQAASPKQVRGDRKNILVLDETCEISADIIDAARGQLITAGDDDDDTGGAEKIFSKEIYMTTPHVLSSKAKELWDRGDPSHEQHIPMVRYNWSAYQCPWISKKKIAHFKNIMDEETFTIEVLGQWASPAGNPFKYGDVMASLCDFTDLPAIWEIDRFYMGIDWGDAHQTVATVMGMTGDVSKGTDRWYVYDQLEFTRQRMDIILNGGIDSKGVETRGIIDLIDMYQPVILSEQSSSSAYANRELISKGISIKTGSFSGRKNMMVKNLVVTFEKGRIMIPRFFRRLINQLIDYHYKVVAGEITEKFEKKKDDHVDSAVWTRWGIPARIPGQIRTVGSLGETTE